MRIFGFEITRATSDDDAVKALGEQDPNPMELAAGKPASFAPPPSDDGAAPVSAGAHYGAYIDLDGVPLSSEKDLILKYRQTAENPECDSAIDDIVNEAVVIEEDQKPVTLNLDDLKQPTTVKKAIQEEFDGVLRLLNFNTDGHDIFRKWYIDGRLVYHKITDPENPKEGIVELRRIDPTKIRKIREMVEKKDPETGATVYAVTGEYFFYQDHPGSGSGIGRSDVGLKIASEAIAYVPSGLLDPRGKFVISHLHKAIKVVNQLRMMEDATVIYRLARAPERRIFYIDTGNLPKTKAEEYMRQIMEKYRNKIVYDSSSGQITTDAKQMSILEDFWLPRREGGSGTQIDTLPGAQQMSTDELEFFKQKLFRALNVPIGRMQPETGFSLGRSSEISRDEVKFQKFISRLRVKFSSLLLDVLKTQLILKEVINPEDWDDLKQVLRVDYRKDSFFAESKENEIFNDRLALLQQMQPFVGLYFSTTQIKKKILRQSDEEIEETEQEMEEDGSALEAAKNALLQSGEVMLPEDCPGNQFGGGGDGPPAPRNKPKKLPSQKDKKG